LGFAISESGPKSTSVYFEVVKNAASR